jgi:hypothetical protein
MGKETLTPVTVVNCTPHPVNILHAESFMYDGIEPKVKISFPASEHLARLTYQTDQVERFIIDNTVIDVTTTQYKRVLGLPKSQKGVIYIVSKLIAEALHDTRTDLYILSGFARNKHGKVLGGRSLAKLQMIRV